MTADKIKLSLAVLILAVGIWGFYYFSSAMPDAARVLAMIAVVAVAAAVAAQTALGRAGLEFARGSMRELRQVVWPSNKETMQVTLIVIALVVVVALFLWGVDWGLVKIVKAITAQGS